ncbi:MAG TPA: hypothetical protein VFZ24_17585 [Longimicrobiales bacterium]
MLRIVAALCAVVLVCGACEGSNLFVGEVSEEPPRITQILAPSSVTVPAQFNVDITGTARSGVSTIEVIFSGAFVNADTVNFPGTAETETARATLDLQQTADSLLIIRAVVEDVTGRVSAPAFDTVRVQ